MKIPVLTLREALAYEPTTGHFTWRERPIWHFSNDHKWPAKEAQSRWNTRYAGTNAFMQINKAGYFAGTVDSVGLLAHRTAMAMRLGDWPVATVDHINGVRTDNRLKNLRLADRYQQSRNTSSMEGGTSKFLGVSYRKDRGYWRANIFVDGKQKSLGTFQEEEAAALAYDEAARTHFKEFARCNFP